MIRISSLACFQILLNLYCIGILCCCFHVIDTKLIKKNIVYTNHAHQYSLYYTVSLLSKQGVYLLSYQLFLKLALTGKCIRINVVIHTIHVLGDKAIFYFRGITAMVLAFLLFGVIQTPDGPFKRPHPGQSVYLTVCMSVFVNACVCLCMCRCITLCVGSYVWVYNR